MAAALIPEADVALAVNRGARLLGLRLLQSGLLFLSAIVIARSLGPRGRAEYALPLALAAGLWVVLNLSLDAAVGRVLARRMATLAEMTRFLAGAIVVQGSVGALATVATGVFLREQLLAGASEAAVLLAAVTMPLTLTVQFASALLARTGMLKALGWSTVGGAGCQLVLVLALERAYGLTPELALAATAIGIGVNAGALVAVLGRRVGLRALVPTWSHQLTRTILRAGTALHSTSIALYLNLRLDLFIVSALTTARQTGLYSLATTLAELMMVAAMTWSQAAAQAQTEADHETAVKYTTEFTRRVWPRAAAMAIISCAAGYPLITWAYGSNWSGSVVPFMLLSLAAVAFAIEGPVRLLLARTSAPGIVSAAAWPAVLINIALNAGLIPVLGIKGAALASLVSYWCYAVLLVCLFRRATGVPMRHVFYWGR